jgi:hypothetical protein
MSAIAAVRERQQPSLFSQVFAGSPPIAQPQAPNVPELAFFNNNPYLGKPASVKQAF